MSLPISLGPLEGRAPSLVLPEGTWDTHFHVLGPQSSFPFTPERKYSPPDAPFEACVRLHERIGIQRGFAVHVNVHGFDNTVDLDAVARSDGRYVAVIRLDDRATPQGCQILHEAGARGVRFAFNPAHGGSLDERVFDHVMSCIEGLGWFVELHFASESILPLCDWMLRIPVPVVIDHIGNVDVAKGTAHEDFAALCGLMSRDRFWMKITCADRLSKTGYPYLDVQPFVGEMLRIAPRRVLWGTDWPHVGIFRKAEIPDDADLVDALARLIPDEALRREVLVENPSRLLKAGAA